MLAAPPGAPTARTALTKNVQLVRRAHGKSRAHQQRRKTFRMNPASDGASHTNQQRTAQLVHAAAATFAERTLQLQLLLRAHTLTLRGPAMIALRLQKMSMWCPRLRPTRHCQSCLRWPPCRHRPHHRMPSNTTQPREQSGISASCLSPSPQDR